MKCWVYTKVITIYRVTIARKEIHPTNLEMVQPNLKCMCTNLVLRDCTTEVHRLCTELVVCANWELHHLLYKYRHSTTKLK